MNINAESARYLNAESVEKLVPFVAPVRDVLMEQVGIGDQKEAKPVLYLHEPFAYPDKGIVLNATNRKLLVAIFGTPETEDWKGRKVTVTVEPVTYMGKLTKGIRFSRAE